MNDGQLNQLEFNKEDLEKAAKIARRLGFSETVYTSTSALWGLFCLRGRSSKKSGCIIKTKELGLMFVQCLDDLNMEDLEDD